MVCATNGSSFIDFANPGSDFKGRFSFLTGTSNYFEWYILSSGVRMTLSLSGLSVVGTVSQTSDKRLKFNDKPLLHALDVINRLEPVEYDQTHCLVDQCSDLQRDTNIRSKSNPRVEPNSEGSTGANRRAASAAQNH
ncbi:MAG: hypothetical protein ACKPKO_25345, partial [Candidatus Fonsibacter sp.]